MRGGSVCEDGVSVLFGAVSFIVVPLVFGVVIGYPEHPFIACLFCQNRRGGDGEIGRVSLWNTHVGHGVVISGVYIEFKIGTIHENELGSRGEAVKTAVSGSYGRLEDVVALNLFHVGVFHTPCTCMFLDELPKNPPFFHREFLTVFHLPPHRVNWWSFLGKHH